MLHGPDPQPKYVLVESDAYQVQSLDWNKDGILDRVFTLEDKVIKVEFGKKPDSELEDAID